MAQIHQLLLFEGRQTALERVTSKAERRVVDLAAAFLGEESADIAYTHPGMCLTVLPHRATTPDEVWSRSNASASLEVHPLRDAAGVYRGVPYGPKARLMLLFLQSEALKTRSRFVELGRSMRQWLLSMGVRDCGTNYKVVADQAERIENCVLRFRYQGKEGESRWQDSIVRGSFRPFAEDGVASVELSEGFYEALTRHPVPICESAIRLLADTCMPLDIYFWLAYRLHSLEQQKNVTWEALHMQFGAGTRLLKHFKPRFTRDLELAMAVYPDALAELTDNGIRLRPSPPPVAPRLRPVAISRISTQAAESRNLTD
ncbi:MAG: replication protein RepA [Geminicoccaceae bacterium]